MFAIFPGGYDGNLVCAGGTRLVPEPLNWLPCTPLVPCSPDLNPIEHVWDVTNSNIPATTQYTSQLHREYDRFIHATNSERY